MCLGDKQKNILRTLAVLFHIHRIVINWFSSNKQSTTSSWQKNVEIDYELKYKRITLTKPTFHDVDDAAHITLLDDEAARGVLHRVHAVDDLSNLSHLQVLHEVVVQNRALYQFPGPGSEEMNKIKKSPGF